MMKKTLVKLLLALVAVPGALFAQITVNANITANTTWTKNNTYILDGRVFVTNGATLTIEPGTVIKGKVRAAQDASALIIARGARINANGSVTEPIIFTAEADQLNGNLGQGDRGLWGGVVILGRARTNTASAQGNIEGIPTTEPLGIYGGTDDNDNSGVFRYVSIRHAGSLLGPNNELNGLTMGAVGAGTTVEFVEVFANADDGFEWFGGTVNGRYLTSAFNDDDAFDWDEGYRGNLQFLFTIQDPSVGNHAFESDGGTTPEDGQPYALPLVYNYTAIGSGSTSTNALSIGPIFRDNTGGKVYNSIFHDFRGYAWRIETESAQSQDSARRLAAGDIEIANNIFGTFGVGTAEASLFLAPNATSGGAAPSTNYTIAHITGTAQANQINTDPLLTSISRTKSAQLDPRPRAGSPALAGSVSTPPSNGFFTATTYKGAFNQTDLWIAGWTKLARDGYLVAASVTLPPSSGSNRLFNMSVNTTLAVNETVVPGFVVEGNGSRNVLVRAIGPGLAQFGVGGLLADPTITLNRVSGGVATVVATNDNWPSTLTATFASAGAFAITAGSTDAALVANLLPGSYTVTVAGKTGNSGQVIVEVYELP